MEESAMRQKKLHKLSKSIPKSFGDISFFSIGKSILNVSIGLFLTPEMNFCMFRIVSYYQIFNTIVKLIAIYVMHYFIMFKITPNFILHNKPMFADIIVFSGIGMIGLVNISIPPHYNLATSPFWISLPFHRNLITVFRTKLCRFRVAFMNKKRYFTSKACQFYFGFLS